jgi:hypothetical protein
MRLAVKAFIRIFLIYIALQMAYYITNYISNMFFYRRAYPGDYDLFFHVIFLVASSLIVLLVIYVLWWKTDWLVRVLLGRTRDRELIISTSNLDLIKVAMRILGVVLLVNAIPELIGLVGYHFSLPAEFWDYPSYYESARETQEFIVVGIKILFGIFLVVGTRKIVDTIDKVWEKTP